MFSNQLKLVLCLALLVLAALTMGGCSVFVDVSAGAPLGHTRSGTAPDGGFDRSGFAGSGAIFRGSIQAVREYNDRLTGYCQVSHTSNTGSGWPVNDEPEGFIHEAGCGARVRIW